MFFFFEVRYLHNRSSDFDDLFLQTADSLIFLSDYIRKVLKGFKVSKGIWNCDFRPKNKNLSILKLLDFYNDPTGGFTCPLGGLLDLRAVTKLTFCYQALRAEKILLVWVTLKGTSHEIPKHWLTIAWNTCIRSFLPFPKSPYVTKSSPPVHLEIGLMHFYKPIYQVIRNAQHTYYLKMHKIKTRRNGANAPQWPICHHHWRVLLRGAEGTSAPWLKP